MAVNNAILAGGIGAVVGTPVITGSANVDTTSIDVVLAAMPTDATSVFIYKKSNNGFDLLVGTLNASGTVNDDNSGAGYDSRTLVIYVAVAIDAAGSCSFPSREIGVEVGEFTVGKRELIKQNVMTQLRTITDANGWPIEVKLVTDTLRHIQRMDKGEMPALFVMTGDCETEYIASQRVEVTLTLLIYGFIHGEENRDTDMNTLIHSVKKALISDDAKFRNGNATISFIGVTDTNDAPNDQMREFTMEYTARYRQDDYK